MALSKENVAYFRNFIFGVEDSLVSTVGLVSGVAIAGLAREEIFIAGIILILVEAVSMGAGSFLSESSAREYETHRETTGMENVRAASIMFVSYALSGFIPLSPYLLLPVSAAFPASIAASLLALIILGLISASITRVNYLKTAFRMALVGGVAIAVGVLAGHILTS